MKVVDARSSVEYGKAFNHLVKEHHYPGFGGPVGQNMKYLLLRAEGTYSRLSAFWNYGLEIRGP
ncbi:MAG: hypothetical protein GY866_43170 [Proteobacteria bacterium]|nr:hypothetical protein [Pseudomonadota bacterium]